jgi:hypothetical protein
MTEAGPAAAGRSAAVLCLADYRRERRRRADWLPVDRVWEETTLAGVGRLVAGDVAGAGPLLMRAQRVAEQDLGADDPRLAASRANLARWLRRWGDEAAAPQLLAAAIAAWELAPGWLARLGVGDAGLSAPQCRRLVEEGRRHAVALAQQRPLLVPCGLERWRARGAPGAGDRRRLLAAVFLSTFRLAPRG